ncbi:MAG: hypothetical protein HYZ42_11530 [Bacteroidetes bacterium]|nr:hypothetical protein [Bacteroidota bacterium]
MVTITKQDNQFIFDVEGMHKLWAFKSQLTIPVEHILNSYQDKDSLKGWKGWRAPGTSLPFVITAGTFHKDGNKIFWDVMNIDNCIIVDLHDEEYKQLVIEV